MAAKLRDIERYTMRAGQHGHWTSPPQPMQYAAHGRTRTQMSQQKSDKLAQQNSNKPRRAVRPKDAATLIIVRRDRAVPEILMGRRSDGHDFLPNKFVFPGGRVDRGDNMVKPHSGLRLEVESRLLKGCSSTKARALGMAAVRETFEETGLILSLIHI